MPLVLIGSSAWETTTSVGTGNIILNGALSSYETFSTSVGVGSYTGYTIRSENSDQYEVGIGLLVGANELERTTIYHSSNGGAAIDLNSCGYHVSSTLPADLYEQHLSNHRGTTEPLYYTDGMLWADDSNAPYICLKIWCEASGTWSQLSCTDTTTGLAVGECCPIPEATSTDSVTGAIAYSNPDDITGTDPEIYWNNTAGGNGVLNIYNSDTSSYQEVSPDEPLNILFFGQSNSLGYGGASGGDQTPDARIKLWNSATSQMEIARFDSSFDPSDGFNPSVSENNAALHFAKALIKYKKACAVNIILDGRGTTPIEDWSQSANTDRYNALITKLNNSGIQRIDAMVFMQGEDNADIVATGVVNTQAGYRAELDILLARLRAEPQIGENVPFIMTELVDQGGSYSDRNDVILALSCEDDPWTGVARAYINGFATPSATNDDIHWDGSALEILGRRIYECYCSLPHNKEVCGGSGGSSIDPLDPSDIICEPVSAAYPTLQQVDSFVDLGLEFSSNNISGTTQPCNRVASGGTNNTINNQAGAYTTVQTKVTGNVSAAIAAFDCDNSGFFALTQGQGHTNTGGRSLLSGLGHNNTSGNNIISGQLHVVSGPTNEVGGAANTVSGAQNHVNGFNHQISGDLNNIGGASHTVSSFSNNVSGSSHFVDGSENNVTGQSHTVSSGQNAVAGVLHQVTGGQNVITGENHTISNFSNIVAGARHNVGGTSMILDGNDHTITNGATNGIVIGIRNSIGISDQVAVLAHSDGVIGNSADKASIIGGYNCSIDNNAANCGHFNSVESYIMPNAQNVTTIGACRVLAPNDNTIVFGNGAAGPALSSNRTGEFDRNLGNFDIAGTFTTGVAFPDYAEVLPNTTGKEIEIGTALTLTKGGVKIADENDTVIGFARTRDTAAFVAGDNAFTHNSKFELDKFGRKIMLEVEEEVVVKQYKKVKRKVLDNIVSKLDDEGKTITEKTFKTVEFEELIKDKNGQVKTKKVKTGNKIAVPKAAKKFNPNTDFVRRSDRPEEWTIVSFNGQPKVKVDKSVEAGNYLAAGKNGVLTKSELQTNLFALEVTSKYSRKDGYGVAHIVQS